MLQNERIEGSPWHSTSIKKSKSHNVPSVRGKTELANPEVRKFYKMNGIKLDLYSFLVCKLEGGPHFQVRHEVHTFEDASRLQYIYN
mgnify:CR=1 FL=1